MNNTLANLQALLALSNESALSSYLMIAVAKPGNPSLYAGTVSLCVNGITVHSHSIDSAMEKLLDRLQGEKHEPPTATR